MLAAEMNFAIRPYDVDVTGIVSNIVYVRWLEDARLELLREHFAASRIFERNLMPVVVRTEINYRASLRFLDECVGRMRLVELRRASYLMQAEFRNGRGEIVCDATQVGVLVDTVSGRAAPVPEEIRAAFAASEQSSRS